MKRYHKSIIASSIILSLALSNAVMTATVLADTTATTTKAMEESVIDAVDVEVINFDTYVIDDKGTLWTNNEANEFDKVCDNVKAVYPANNSGCLILKTDGTLVYGLEIRHTNADEKTGELELNNTWEFFEVEKGVKSASSEVYGYGIYILKNNGNVIFIDRPDVYLTKLAYTGTKYEKYFNEYVQETEPTKTVIVNNAKAIVHDEIYGPMLYYIDNKDTLYAVTGYTEYVSESVVIPHKTPYKLLDNVKDIKVWGNNKVALTKDGKVYTLGQSYFNDYVYNDDGTGAPLYEPEGIVNEVLGFKTDLDLFGKPTLICEDAKKIDANYSAIAVIKNDNSLWVMGENSDGQLGLGEKIDNSKYVNDKFPLAKYAKNPSFAGTLIKVAENVADVRVHSDMILCATLDGRLFAAGRTNSAQIKNYEGPNTVYLDSNGFYKAMTDVSEMSLGEAYSLTIKEDGSLWGFGTDTQLESIFETDLQHKAPEKLVEQANWANDANYNILYTTGKNNDLYSFGSTKDVRDKVKLYKLQLLGYDKLTLDDVKNETIAFNEAFLEYAYKDEAQRKEVYEKLAKYADELIKESNKKVIATNVKYADENFYLTFDNKLFERTDSGNNLVASGVTSYFKDDKNLYIVDTKGNLKYSPYYEMELRKFDYDVPYEELEVVFKDFDDYNIEWDYSGEIPTAATGIGYNVTEGYNFIDTGITKVKDIKTDIFGYMVDNFTLYVLREDNSFVNFNMEYTTVNPESEVSPVILNFKDYKPTVLAEKVKSFDVAFYGAAYVTTEGVLYGLGENVAHQFDLVDFNYFSLPLEIMKDVEEVQLNEFGGSMFTLKEDGTLLTSGGNGNGELGYAPFSYDVFSNKSYTPIEVDLSK